MPNTATVTIDILEFIYAFELVPKMAIRCLGFSYSYSGRAVRGCVENGYLKEQRSQGEVMLRITKRGIQYLEKAKGVEFSEQLTQALANHAKGTGNRIRQRKLVWAIAMMYHQVPNIAAQYIESEKEYQQNLLNIPSLNSNGENSMLEETPKRRTFLSMSTIERIQDSLQKRAIQNNNGNWHILTREMRMLDLNGLRKMSAVRSMGIWHLQDRSFTVYNSMSSRMEIFGDYEIKYNDYVSQLLHEYNLSLIVFAKSYKVALDTIRTPKESRKRYVLGSSLYKTQFYVPLVSGGAKQLDIYAVPHFREAAREALLSNADIARAKNFIYDGETENKTAIFLGFECELKEIQKIYDIHTTIRANSPIIVYCFPWQSKFYHDLFGDRCELKVVDDGKFMEFLAKRPM